MLYGRSFCRLILISLVIAMSGISCITYNWGNIAYVEVAPRNMTPDESAPMTKHCAAGLSNFIVDAMRKSGKEQGTTTWKNARIVWDATGLPACMKFQGTPVE